MNPPPLPSKQSPFYGNCFVFEPMPDPKNPITLLENLLKFPGRVVHELHQTRAVILTAWLLIFGIIGVAIYGIVVGAQSSGAQMWIAPAKLGLGTLLSVLICLPSLYIFTCLGGDRRATAQRLRRAFRSCLSELDFINRFCAGGVDFLTIHRLNRFHGCAAFALLDDRNPFWSAADRCDAPVSRCY